MLLKEMLLLCSLLALIGVALWGLLRQRQHVLASLSEYDSLKKVESAEIHLVAFNQLAHEAKASDPKAIQELQAASLALRQYKALISQYDSVLPPEIPPDVRVDVKERTNQLVTSLVQWTVQLGVAKPTSRDPKQPPESIDQLTAGMTALLSICNGFVQRTEVESAGDVRQTITVVSCLALCIFIAALMASIWQYQRIINPLHRLRLWCRRTAQGEFAAAYQPGGDREFRELGHDVNQMAAELEAFNRRLESMVESKSRELVQSERLASVGYLAAGVAHEINSPLNIMSGYAELSIKRLGRLGDSDAQVLQNLSIIRSEAFRCKEITQKLLSLARGSGDRRESISLADAVIEVADLVRGLTGMRGKQLEIRLPAEEKMLVHANLTELKQVLLNLMVNSIEAIGDGGGIISVSGWMSGPWAELNVADNGRGMSAQTLQRVFEPFFTHKRGAGQPGTGLGLSITHAIIRQHQGELTAHSDGIGRGARFTIRLPALAGETSITPARVTRTNQIEQPVST